VPYIGRMLLLPTGQVLFAAQTGDIYAYNYLGCIDSAARPQITAAPVTVAAVPRLHPATAGCSTACHRRSGTGDDAAAATNYQLVRLRHLATGIVRYCRTYDHSTMGVGTGATCTARTSWCRSACPPDRASSWWWPTG